MTEETGTGMSEEALPRAVNDIPGWFGPIDQFVFEFFLRVDAPERGDVVELGAYKGKSAAFIGAFVRGGETFTVCDLFGGDAEAKRNAVENKKSYSDLDRDVFERNYRAVRGDLPVVIQAPSSAITEQVKPASARFVHVDASHLYPHVVEDIRSAETMMQPGGVVVFDDYRSFHTPGVAAAVWGAVAEGRLRPVCLTWSKLYAVFDDPDPHRERLLGWLRSRDDLKWVVNEVSGQDVVRVRPLSESQPAKPQQAKPDPVIERLDRIHRRLTQLEASAPGGAGRTSATLRRIRERVRRKG